MSSKKRSHNFNDEENKENDNRNPFCPKKPITTTLFEQRQAQNLQTQQNRAAGRAKRRSGNHFSPVRVLFTCGSVLSVWSGCFGQKIGPQKSPSI